MCPYTMNTGAHENELIALVTLAAYALAFALTNAYRRPLGTGLDVSHGRTQGVHNARPL